MGLQRRRSVAVWACIVVLAIVIAIGLVMLGVAVSNWHRGKQELRVRGQVGAWIQWSGKETADATHTEWLAVRRSLGAEYDRLEACGYNTPYWTLSEKYLGEGKYREAFRMYEKAKVIAGKRGDFGVVYLAAVAGDSQWLRDSTYGTGQPEDSLASRFRSAVVAWAASDRDQVMKLTDPDNLQAAAGDAGVPRGVMAWMMYLRARAMAENGRPEAAIDLLAGYVFTNLSEMDVSQCLRVHIVIVSAEVADRAGYPSLALKLAEAAAQSSWIKGDVSWAAQIASLERMADRLRGQLKSTKE